MKTLLVYFLILNVVALSAQSVDKTVVASAGDEISISEVSIGFTIGEPIVGIAKAEAEGSIDQGFWASSLQVEAITAEKDLDGIKVYPNPFENSQKVCMYCVFL